MSATLPYASDESLPSDLPAPQPEASEYDGRARLALAGALLLVNAGLSASGQVLQSLDGGEPPRMLPVLIDVLLAVEFLKGKDKYRGFAIFRVIVAVLFFSWLKFAEGDALTAVLLAIGNGGMLLVLIGQPSRNRRILGAALFGVVALLELVGQVLL